LNGIACLLVKDRASLVVSKNIKLYIPLIAMGVTSQVINCDHFVCETGKGVTSVRECLSL
jgi:hypothetical protein